MADGRAATARLLRVKHELDPAPFRPHVNERSVIFPGAKRRSVLIFRAGCELLSRHVLRACDRLSKAVLSVSPSPLTVRTDPVLPLGQRGTYTQ